jgi:L-alanine-DL-glutamate epimerase-like enolase superfamily enzyme
MKITDVRAHHVRIPYDAGVASFKQGASSIAAVDIALVEVSTDAGLTGWGDGFAYVCPRSVATAVDEMIAPQARGQEVPDAAGIPAFMERTQRNLHLFGRYGITMFAISALDIALWDLAAKAKGVPLHRLLGTRKRTRLCEPAAHRRPGARREGMRDRAQPRLPGDQAARDDGAAGPCCAPRDRRRRSAHGRPQLPSR